MTSSHKSDVRPQWRLSSWQEDRKVKAESQRSRRRRRVRALKTENCLSSKMRLEPATQAALLVDVLLCLAIALATGHMLNWSRSRGT